MAFIDGNNGENFMTVMGFTQYGRKPKDEVEQPQILQCDCVECSLYDGFGQCLEHGNQLKDNCEDFELIED